MNTSLSTVTSLPTSPTMTTFSAETTANSAKLLQSDLDGHHPTGSTEQPSAIEVKLSPQSDEEGVFEEESEPGANNERKARNRSGSLQTQVEREIERLNRAECRSKTIFTLIGKLKCAEKKPSEADVEAMCKSQDGRMKAKGLLERCLRSHLEAVKRSEASSSKQSSDGSASIRFAALVAGGVAAAGLL